MSKIENEISSLRTLKQSSKIQGGEFIGGKGVSGSQKRSEEFHCDGCVTYYVTYFIYIDHVYI